MEEILKALQVQNQQLRLRFGITMPSTDEPCTLTDVAPKDDKSLLAHHAISASGPSFVIPELVQPKPKPFDQHFDRRTGEFSKTGTVYSERELERLSMTFTNIADRSLCCNRSLRKFRSGVESTQPS
jgi:hypothetical protein